VLGGALAAVEATQAEVCTIYYLSNIILYHQLSHQQLTASPLPLHALRFVCSRSRARRLIARAMRWRGAATTGLLILTVAFLIFIPVSRHY
jgi:hypothetical protein